MKSHLIGKKLLFIACFLLIFAVLLTTASFAWLVFFTSEIDTSEIGGQLLTNYFHSGTGREADPFIITRPTHFYNLVNLYQRVSDYSDNAYYFQIGTKLKQDDDSYYVYNYDNNGNFVEGSPYSRVLNLAYYNGENALLPIGTHDKNFLGHFNGNGLTVSNFTVSTLADEKDCDIGIFGFVGENADIHDIYFSNVTIDLSNVRSSAAVINAATAGQTHNPTAHNVNSVNLAYVGCIAGHVITNAQFRDVYINNVSFAGGGSEAAATSGFGYFGCIEKPDGTLVDALGESLPDMIAGGIGMDGIYGRLASLRNSAVAVPFTVSKSVWVNGENTEEFDVISTSVIRENDPNSSAGSFSFSKDSEGGEGNTVYLTGKTSMAQTVTTYTVTGNDGFYLASQSGNTYLKLNAAKTGLETTPTADEATVWGCDAEGNYFTTEINDAAHTCDYYYITVAENSGVYNAVISTTPTTQWTYDGENNQMYCTAGGLTWYLAFNGEGLGEAGGSTKDYVRSVAGGTTYYLVVNGDGSLSATTDENSATKVAKNVTTGFLYVQGNNTLNIGYDTSSTAANKPLKTGSTGYNASYISETWVINNYEIFYEVSSSTWKVRKMAAANFTELYLFKTVSPNNNFLSVQDIDNDGVYELANTSNTGSSSSVTIPSNVHCWTLPQNNDSNFGYITTVVNGTKYYLVGTTTGLYNTNRLMGTVSITTNESEASLWFRGGSYIYLTQAKNRGTSNRTAVYNGVEGNCYLQYSNKGGDTSAYKWKVDYSSGSATINMAFPLDDSDGGGEGENGNLTQNANGSIHKNTTNNPQYQTAPGEESIDTVQFPIDTWFPILAGGDGAPTNDNFGYVVSGMQYKQNDLYRSGDVWFTESNINSISGSYSGGAFTDIYTVNASGTVNANSVAAFSGYTAAKSGLGALLNGKSNIHALRFMNSTVSAADTVTLSSASVYGTVYTDRAMPRHCVDVTLQDDGCISLFAGNYYAGNTGFFSLYQVIRNGEGEISEIKKISKIYKQGNSINYVYDGESAVYAGDLVFDSAWMSGSVETGNELFYFEIPVTAGEYALGAEDGNNGAYLLYLSVAETELVLGDENGLTEYGFMVDVRSTGYTGSEDYVAHSLLQFSVNAPGVSADDFSVEVSFTNSELPIAYSKGLYTIAVVNRTGTPIDMTVYLCDDDGVSGNEYLYAYQIMYTNATVTDQTVMNGTKTYFQGCAELIIP